MNEKHFDSHLQHRKATHDGERRIIDKLNGKPEILPTLAFPWFPRMCLSFLRMLNGFHIIMLLGITGSFAIIIQTLKRRLEKFKMVNWSREKPHTMQIEHKQKNLVKSKVSSNLRGLYAIP